MSKSDLKGKEIVKVLSLSNSLSMPGAGTPFAVLGEVIKRSSIPD